MTTATLTARPTLTPRQVADVRSLLRMRETALADLRGTNPDRQFAEDRIADVTFANGAIERLAGRLGVEPAEVIAAVAAA